MDDADAVELFDDCWFFQNLLRDRNKMVRSASDPYPSSYTMAEVFARIQSDSVNHLKKSDLKRTPSLPVSLGMEKEEKEVVPRSSRLSRQTSLCHSNVLPPQPLKTTRSTPAMPKPLPRRQSMGESTIKNNKPRCYNTKDMMHRSLSLNKNSKSRTQLEIEEVQGFKDLGFDFDKLNINPSVADILPGLQSKKPEDCDDEDKVRRPYLSEAWHVQSPAPLMPDWIDPGSVGDMKKQLKYWARAVASNMRQEC